MKNVTFTLLLLCTCLYAGALRSQTTLITNPANGHYCQGSVPVGVEIKIENSQNGQLYILKKQGTPGNIAQVNGNGNTVTFPGFHTAGTYLTTPATNNVTVVMDPLPIVYLVTITNGGIFCNYPNATGATIGMANSQPNVRYTLYKGLIEITNVIPGGGGFTFGTYIDPGQYRVEAENVNSGCSKQMGLVKVISNDPPTTNFSAAPQNQCANDPVAFTDLSIANAPGAQIEHWLWNFSDPNSGTKNTSTLKNPHHTFEAWGNATETFQVNLKIIDDNGCEAEITKPVIVKQKPDARITASGPGISTKVVDDTVTFAYCGADISATFTFTNISTTNATNTWYTINWGDASPDYSSAQFAAPINHLYSGLGFKTLTYTVNGANGCNHVKKYYIFIGSTPSGGIASPGNTWGVAPFTLDFPISPETYFNTPGTKYTIDFGDGTFITFFQNELPANHLLSHTYTDCSTELDFCVNPNDLRYTFKATCTAANPCDETYSIVCPIYVSCPVVVIIDTLEGQWGAGPGQLIACNPVSFGNLTQFGFYIINNGLEFTTETHFEWNFGDPASGPDNISTEFEPVHNFTQSGVWYTVSLTAWTGESINNNSGIFTVTIQLFVQEPPLADFQIENFDPCLPAQIQFTNLSFDGGGGVPEFKWIINPPAGAQFVTPGFEGLNNVPDPLIQFNTSGYFTIRLIIENSCGPDTLSETIIICEPPEVSFDEPIFSFCGEVVLELMPEYEINCDTLLPTYLWNITGPAPVTYVAPTSNTSPFPLVQFNDVGTYEATVTITNECGSETATQQIILSPVITNNIITPQYDQMCSDMAPINIAGSLPEGGSGIYDYTWQKRTAALPWAVTGGNTQSYTHPNPLTITTYFRRIVTDDGGNCADTSAVVEIEIFPGVQNNSIVDDQQVCMGNAPDLLTGTIAFGGNGQMTYKWYESADGINWNLLIGAVLVNYQPANLFATTWFRREAISEPCDSLVSNSVKIEVCDPVSNNMILEDQTICTATAPDILTGSLPDGACGNFTYQWQKATDVQPVFANVPAANGQNYQPPAINVKTYFRRLVISDICENDTSNVVTISLWPLPVANAGMDQIISNGMTVNLSGTASGGTPPYASYRWEPAGQIAGNPNLPNVTTVQLTNDVTFTFCVTDANGCEGCDQVYIDVTGDALSVAVDPLSAQICPGESATLCAMPTGGTGNYTFSWTSQPPGFISGNECITVSPAITTNYQLVVFDGFSTVSALAQVVVLPVPSVTSVLSLTVCSGVTLDYEPQSNVPGSTYQWTTQPNGSCTGNSGGVGDIIEDAIINTSSDICAVFYEITPIGPAPNLCVGLSVTLEVQVMPVAQISNNINQQTVISGQLTQPVTFTSNVTGVGFHWEYHSTTCPGFTTYQLEQGETNLLPAQVVTIEAGGSPTCIITYEVTAYLVLPDGTECRGTPYLYHYVINLQPTAYELICPAPVCFGQSATISLAGSELGVEYLLLRNAVFPVLPIQPGTGDTLQWQGITTPGFYSIRATNLSNNQSSMMDGICQLTVNPLPLIYQLTAQGGETCIPVIPLLSGSQLGVTYQLIYNGNSVVEVVNGTGLPGFLVFNEVTLPGTYTVHAINPFTGCERDMWGSIEANPSPLEFPIIPGGVLCEGVVLCIDGWEPGAEYQLWKDDEPYSAFQTGIPNDPFVCFDPPTNGPGIYRVFARFVAPQPGCDLFFSEPQIVHENPLVYHMAPDTCCPGGEIFLEGCQPGIEYELWFESPIPAEIAGPLITIACDPLNPNLSFGQWWDEGTYTIKAVNPATNCFSWMEDQTFIVPAPEIYNMEPVGAGCQPLEIFLDNSQEGVEYRLYRNGVWIQPVVIGDAAGGPISFGVMEENGLYTIHGFYTHGDSCWSVMNGFYEIVDNPTAYTVSPPPGIYCPCPTVTLSSSQIGIAYFLINNTTGIWYPNNGIGIPGTGDGLSWDEICDPGDYRIYARKIDDPNCNSNMTGTFTIGAAPEKFELTSIQFPPFYCEGDNGITLTLAGSQSLITVYQLFKVALPVDQPVGAPVIGTGGELTWNNMLAGTYYVVAKFVNDPTCPANMLNAVTVVEIPLPSAQVNAPPLVCQDDCFDLSFEIIGVGPWNIHYSREDATNGLLNFEINNIATSPFIIPNVCLTETTTFAITSVQNSTPPNCQGVSFGVPVVVDVVPLPVVNAGADGIICADATYTLSGDASAHCGLQWTTSGDGVFDDNTIEDAVYMPGIADVGNGSVTLCLSALPCAPCPAAANDCLTLIINALPAITSSADLMMCSGEALNYTITTDLPGATVVWTSQNNTAGCITGNSDGTAFLMNDVLVNHCNSVKTITYTILPTGPAPTLCEGAAHVLTVQILPVAIITNLQNEQFINSGEQTQPVAFINNILNPEVTYQWSGIATIPELTGWIANGNTATLPAMLITIDGANAPDEGEVIYTVTPFAGGCAGEPFNYTIHVYLLPSVFQLTGGGEFCDDGVSFAEIRLMGSQPNINYRLNPNGITQPGNGGLLIWQVTQSGLYSVTAINPNTGVEILMDGNIQVIARDLPLIYNLTIAAQGDACVPIIPRLNGSQAGAYYQLYCNGVFTQEKQGTGAAILFDAVTQAGTYTAEALVDYDNITCSRTMNGAFEALSIPAMVQITPNAPICENEDEICILNSEMGIVYQLWSGNQPVGNSITGIGGLICFGIIDEPGIYRVHASNPTTGCEVLFPQQIVVNSAPLQYQMTPAKGCPGTEIFLNNCQAGILYSLYFQVPPADGPADLTAVAGPIDCNGGGAISFGTYFDAGTYSVLGFNPETNCDEWMETTTVIYPDPLEFEVRAEGDACPPRVVYLEDCQEEVEYILYYDDLSGNAANPVPLVSKLCENGEVRFENLTQPGIYTIRAIWDHGAVVCEQMMSGSVAIDEQPVVYTILPNAPTCPPAVFYLNGSEENVLYELIYENGIIKDSQTGDGVGVVEFAPQFEPGVYNVKALSVNGCDTIMDSIGVILPAPQKFAMTPNPGGKYCVDDNIQIGMVNSVVGITYLLQRVAAGNNPQATYPGSGQSFVFNPAQPLIAGTYRIKAIDDLTGCIIFMDGLITIYDNPDVYTITAEGFPVPNGGDYCPPVDIGLTWSEVSVKYSLYCDEVTGGPVATLDGTGGILNFGTFDFPGGYHIEAKHLLTSCDKVMAGVVNISDGPVVYSVSCENPLFCEGNTDQITLVLDDSQQGVAYELLLEGQPVVPPYIIIGNGGMLQWQNVSGFGEGIYTITATFADDPMCSAVMLPGILVQELSLPTAQLSGDTITICNGDTASIPLQLTGELLDWKITWSIDGVMQPPDTLYNNGAPQFLKCAPTQPVNVGLIKIEYLQSPGCVGTVAGNFLILVDPVPDIYAGDDAGVCLGDTLLIQNAYAENIKLFNWEMIPPAAGIVINANTLTPLFVPNISVSNSMVELVLHAGGTGACAYQEVTSSVFIQVDSLPMAVAGSNAIICVTDTFYLQGFAANYGNVLWEDLSGLGTFNPNPPGVLDPVYYLNEPDTIAEPVDIILRLTAEGMGACGYQSYSSTLILTAIPEPRQVSAGEDAIICENATYTTTSATALQYSALQWATTGDGLYDNPTTLSCKYTPGAGDIQNGQAKLYLDVQPLSPCTLVVSDTMVLSIRQLPQISAGVDTLLCENIMFYEVPATATNQANVKWRTNGDGYFDDSSLVTPKYTFGVEDILAGIVELCFTAYPLAPCAVADSASDCMMLTIQPMPLAEAGLDKVICENTSLYFDQTMVMAANYDSLLWRGGDGQFDDATILNTTYTPGADDISAGAVMLCLTAYAESPCLLADSVQSCMELLITPLPVAEAGNDITLCENETLLLEEAFALNYDSLLWRGGDGWFDDATLLAATYSPGAGDIAVGTVTLCLTAYANAPCLPADSLRTCLTLTIQTLPEVDAGSDATVCESTTTYPIIGAAAENYSALQWTTIPAGLGEFSDVTALNPDYSLPEINNPIDIQMILTATGLAPCDDSEVMDMFWLHIDPLPEIDAGDTLEVCVANHVQIKDADTAFITGFTWVILKGEGTLDDPLRLDPTYYPAPGDATDTAILVLQAMGTAACSNEPATDTVRIIVSGLPSISIANPVGVICMDDPDGYTVAEGFVVVENYSSYQWELVIGTGNGQLLNANTLTPTYHPSAWDAGKNVVLKLRANGLQVCTNFQSDADFIIKVGARPVADFEPINNMADSVLCPGQQTWFEDLSGFGYSAAHPDQTITNRIWDFGDGDSIDSGTETFISHTYAAPGAYTVKLIVVTAIDGITTCADSTMLTATIKEPPVAGFSYRKISNCVGLIQFYDTSWVKQSYITDWWWTFGEDYYSDLQNPQFEFESSGAKTVTLTVTDRNGCIGYFTDTIFIDALFDFEVKHQDACYGEATRFWIDSASILPPGNIIQTYEWTFGDGNSSSNIPAPEHIYTHAGEHQVVLKTIDASGCEKVKSLMAVVPVPLEPAFSFDDCRLTVLFSGYTASVTDDVSWWAWDFGDGKHDTIFAPEQPVITHTYTNTEVYAVTLTVADTKGCSETYAIDTIRTECLEYKGLYIPNAFAPEHPNKEVSVFLPKGIGLEEYHISVYDLWGNKLWGSSALDDGGSPTESWNGKYKNTTMPPGTYVYNAYAKFKDGTVWGNDATGLGQQGNDITGTILLIR
jgi:PKD repeat protein